MILRGADDRQWREMRAQQAMTYSLAQLVKIAVNDPKRMPDFKKAFPGLDPVRPQTPDEILASMKQWTAAIAARGGK